MTDEPDEEREPTLLVDEVVLLSDAVRGATRAVVIHLEAEGIGRNQLVELGHLLRESPGSCPVEVVFALPDGASAVMAVEGARVDPSDAMLSGLERVFGATVAELR